ncbi:unnamed protein product [Caenorhabditis auriculariae]|uniref:Uncharacterized protein n=1 Tax=Caenorhabditis auriculariae TaxID=2777116 RepID=A0A8S1GNW7_9PELO|nr:unnamed protein product [Caenorhabditis auriculariae]
MDFELELAMRSSSNEPQQDTRVLLRKRRREKTPLGLTRVDANRPRKRLVRCHKHTQVPCLASKCSAAQVHKSAGMTPAGKHRAKVLMAQHTGSRTTSERTPKKKHLRLLSAQLPCVVSFLHNRQSDHLFSMLPMKPVKVLDLLTSALTTSVFVIPPLLLSPTAGELRNICGLPLWRPSRLAASKNPFIL